VDPFDEFEMKPITSGLGFHKKAVNLSEQVKKTELTKPKVNRSIPPAPPAPDFLDEGVQKKATDTLDDLLAALKAPEEKREVPKPKKEDLGFSETLPRNDLKRRAFEVEPVTQVEPRGETYVDPIPQPELNIDEAAFLEETLPPAVGVRRSGHDSAPLRILEAQPVSLASAAMDSLVVLGFSLVFLLSLLLVTRVNLLNVYNSAQNDFLTQLSVVSLYVAVMQIYVIISRSFFGKTLAEWTFELQMGDDEQQKKSLYPLQVLWRSIVVTLTGVILLPLLSFIVRRDLTFYFTGLQLYRKK